MEKIHSEFDLICDSLLEGVQILDFDLRYVYVNETVVAYQNADKKSLIGRKITERFPEIVNYELFGILQKCITQRVAQNAEMEFVYPDKTRKWFDVAVKPIQDHLLILTIDITAKKNAEAEKDRSNQIAIQNERRFRHSLDMMLEGAQILDFDWRYLYVNDALLKSSQYSRETLVGRTMMDCYPGVEKTMLYEKIQRCMLAREGSVFENRFTFPDGTQGVFDLSIQPVPEGVFILSVDKSSQHKSEEKLLKANRLYAFLSAINQSIVHLKNQKELLDMACDVAVRTGGFKIALAVLFDELTLAPAIAAIKGEADAVERVKTYLGVDKNIENFATTLMVRSLRSGRYAVSNNAQTDPTMGVWQPKLKESELESVISLPLKRLGKVIGVFVLTSVIENFFDAEEIFLLEEAASDISFALENFEQAKRHMETEELVLKNERRFRALIEHSADMKTLATRDGELLYISPSVTKVLGYTQEDLLSTVLFEFIHPDEIDVFIEKRDNTMDRPGASFSFQQRRRHKDGHWLWCEGTVTNMLNEPGVMAMVSNFRDISDKKIAEQSRDFDRNNLNALINNTGDLMWSVDRSYNLITSNAPFHDWVGLMGRTIEEGETIFKSAESEEQSRFKNLYDRAFRGETFMEIEYDDSPVEQWSEISYCPIRQGNEIIGAACHSRDITAKKKTDRQLEKSETFNKGVLNSLNSHIAVVDKIGTIIAVNEAWKRFAVENSDSTVRPSGVGSNYFNECSRAVKRGHASASSTLKGMKAVMSGEIPPYYEEYECSSPEKQRWFSMRALKFDSEEPMVVVSHEDISVRKIAEEELINKNNELQKTNTELDKFAYSISHDLRSPLSSVLGLASIIDMESKETRTIECSKMISESITRLDELLKNILNYSRNNRAAIEIAEIKLEQTIKDCVNGLRNGTESNGISFVMSVKEPVKFFSDPLRVRVILENLVSNAIKFHSTDGRERFVKITGEVHPDHVLLEIEDNGIGIAAEFHQRIFDMFFRLPHPAAGSGIGLYIVNETINKLQGSINMESEVGSGTTFFIKMKNFAD
jgi:PAS domain S-box-containing protein